MRATASIAQYVPGSMLDPETLSMLEAGNTAPPTDTQRLLRASPRAPEQLIADSERDVMRREAQLGWLLPMLRIGIALIWIWTGIVSLGLYPTQSSYELLARVGVGAGVEPQP